MEADLHVKMGNTVNLKPWWPRLFEMTWRGASTEREALCRLPTCVVVDVELYALCASCHWKSIHIGVALVSYPRCHLGTGARPLSSLSGVCGCLREHYSIRALRRNTLRLTQRYVDIDKYYTTS